MKERARPANGRARLLRYGKRPPAGRVAGVDLWRSQDQSGNDIDVLGPRYWCGGPWAATTMVTATKTDR